MSALGELAASVAPAVWALAVAITLVSGFVKGAVGFAMPTIMISGLSSIMAPELALAILILPTLVTNSVQALRNGIPAARIAMRTHHRYILIVVVMVAASAQLVRILPDRVLYLLLGLPITVFAAIQLVGVRLSIPPRRRGLAELTVGGFAGFVGGMSGVWGPPTVLYLTALETPKTEQIQVQGIVYGLAAAMLTVAHVNSGVLTGATAPLSALFIVPALAGTAVGFRFCDRLDQERFRRLTLAVLAVAGLNLVRRGLMG